MGGNRQLTPREMTPFCGAAYVQHLKKRAIEKRSHARMNPKGRSYAKQSERTALAAPSVKQHLAAIRMLFDWLWSAKSSP
jgi:hypothetical protein